MDPAVYILLAIVVALIPIFRKEIKDLQKSCDKINERETVVETKLDIFLEHSGFDCQKVNKVIREHMSELKQNGRPNVGSCINIKELYR